MTSSPAPAPAPAPVPSPSPPSASAGTASSDLRTLLAVTGMLAGGAAPAERRRRRLMAIGAALATVLLLAAGNLLAVRGSWSTAWAGLVAEPGLRGGTALAIALLVFPVLTFVYQASRIAQATQDRRLAALRMAGATPRAVRLIAAMETGRISAAGALAGCVFYTAVQWTVLLAASIDRPGRFAVPPVQLPVALVLVIAGGAAAGLLAARNVTVSPLGVTRRAPHGRPGPKSLSTLAIAAVLLAVGLIDIAVTRVGFGYPVVALGALFVPLGLLLSTSWLIGRTAHAVAGRTRRPETLLAARALEADPRAWGRVLGVVGLVVFFGSGAGWIEASVIGREEPFWKVSMGLLDLALVFAIVVAAAALTVHRAESLMEGRRVLASLNAGGVQVRALRRAAMRQAMLAAAPVCAAAGAAGLLLLAPYGARSSDAGSLPFHYVVLWAVGRALVMTLLGVTAAMAVTLLSRSMLSRAAAPTELRAE